MKAIWKDVVIAESDNTVIVENNHYFPVESVNRTFLSASDTTSICPWKGMANYYSITVDEDTNADAVWYYAEPKQAAANIKDHIAFWKGVTITE